MYRRVEKKPQTLFFKICTTFYAHAFPHLKKWTLLSHRTFVKSIKYFTIDNHKKSTPFLSTSQFSSFFFFFKFIHWKVNPLENNVSTLCSKATVIMGIKTFTRNHWARIEGVVFLFFLARASFSSLLVLLLMLDEKKNDHRVLSIVWSLAICLVGLRRKGRVLENLKNYNWSGGSKNDSSPVFHV